MKLYYYGKSFGRHDESVFKGSIDTDDIDHLRTLEMGTDEFDDAVEVLMNEHTWDYSNVIVLIIQEMREEAIELIKKGHPGGLVSEECEFGLGATKERAKLSYADLADDDEEDW